MEWEGIGSITGERAQRRTVPVSLLGVTKGSLGFTRLWNDFSRSSSEWSQCPLGKGSPVPCDAPAPCFSSRRPSLPSCILKGVEQVSKLPANQLVVPRTREVLFLGLLITCLVATPALGVRGTCLQLVSFSLFIFVKVKNSLAAPQEHVVQDTDKSRAVDGSLSSF